MIDLHTHPIAGIDDGVQSQEEAVEMCRIAVAEGITTLAATPHIREGMFPNRRAGILRGLQALQQQLEKEKVPLRLVAGAEVYLEPEIADKARAGEYLTLNDAGRYLLLELPTRHLPAGIDDVIYQLRLEGLTPLLAHPERIIAFQEDPTRYARLLGLGALGQITGGSLLGQFGPRAMEAARSFLRAGQVHVIASDAHNSGARAPRLAEAVREAARIVGSEAARRLVLEIPRAILDGEEVEAPPLADEPPRPAGWRAWLRGWGRP